MKAYDITVESRVRLISDYSQKGIVIGNKLPSGDEVLAVEWDNGDLDRVNVHDVEVFDNIMEEDFVQIEQEVNAAASALAKANALCDKHNTTLYDVYYSDDHDISLRNLFDELDAGGWFSSSMRC